MSKSKYTKRRAIDCKIVEKSKNNPGYLKYMVTIAEMDGTIHKQPAYGKDMQDALSRLINTERTIKMEKKMERNPFVFFLLWMLIMMAPVLIHGEMTYTPWFVSFTALFLIAGWWQSYLERGK
jgi:hypothetical protein